MNNLSSSEPTETPPQTAEAPGTDALLQEIGRKLSQARESTGESLEEAVRKLKLQKRHLLALEQGNWNNMPDDVYMLGFLRQYGQYLHVDLADDIDRLKHQQYALTKPLTFPDLPVAPSRRWAWLAGIAFVLLFILFNISTKNTRIGDTDLTGVSKVPETEQLPMDSPSTTHPTMNQLQPDRPEEPAAIRGTETDATPRPLSSASAAYTIDTPKQAENSRREMIMPATSANVTANVISNVTANKTTMHHFRFDAVHSPVWIQIFMPDAATTKKGKLLKEVLLQPGFHAYINEKTSVLWITCGNAPALRIVVDGHIYADTGTLGAGKKVLRDFRFQISND